MTQKGTRICKAALLLFSVLAVMSPEAGAYRGLETYGRTPDLRGLAGPYRFEKYCSPGETELWTVGGQGEVLHITREPTPRRFKLKSAGNFRGDLYGVYFNKEGVGWVVGDSGVIFHTPDRGVNWVEQSVGGEDDINAITCADNNTCWAVGGEGLLLRTNDGGGVWSRTSISPKSVDLNAVEFINGKAGWVAGDDNSVLRTTNGGLTWESYKALPSCGQRDGCGEPLSSIRFISEQVGWVASSDQIARTVDGGQTWKSVSLEDRDSTVSLVGLISHDGKKVWAVNAGDHNFFSTDAGSTWRAWPLK